MGGFSLTDAINNIATAQNEKFEDILGVATAMAGGGSVHGIDALAEMGAEINGEKISDMIKNATDNGDFGLLRGLLDAIAQGKDVKVFYNKTTNILSYTIGTAEELKIDLNTMEDFDVQGLEDLVGTGGELTIGAGEGEYTISAGLTWTAGALDSGYRTMTATDDSGNKYTIKVADTGTQFSPGSTYKNDIAIDTSGVKSGVGFTPTGGGDKITTDVKDATGISGTVELTADEIQALDVGLTNADGIMQNPGTLYLISTTLQQMNQGISGQGATGTTAANVMKEAVQTYQRGLNQ